MVTVMGLMHTFLNVGWNCEGGIMTKGGILSSNTSVGGHFRYNNTIFNSVEKNDIMVLNEQGW